MPTIRISTRAGEVSAHTALPAGGASTDVVFDTDSVREVDVVNRGDGAAWYTTDGTVPAVGGPRCFYLPPRSVDRRACRPRMRC